MARMMLLAGFPPESRLPPDAAGMLHVRRFLDDWGRAGDVGVVAVDATEQPLGAAWARVLTEPLTHDERGKPVAEVAIGVEAEHRNTGIGTALLNALAQDAAAAGHRELLLRVSPRNPAVRLDRRVGFEVVHKHSNEVVMRRRLR
jgi:GNAT superfamily N-acetyltransferase